MLILKIFLQLCTWLEVIRCMFERRKIHTSRRICKLNPKAYDIISCICHFSFIIENELTRPQDCSYYSVFVSYNSNPAVYVRNY